MSSDDEDKTFKIDITKLRVLYQNIRIVFVLYCSLNCYLNLTKADEAKYPIMMNILQHNCISLINILFTCKIYHK